MDIRKNKMALATATAAAVMVASGAYAAIPSASGRIFYICYSNSTGAVRVVDNTTTSACPSGETMSWFNQRGDRGPTGPQGPAGEKGPPGDSNKRWARIGADGRVLASSDGAAQAWDQRMNGGDGYVYFPGFYTPESCALTVTPQATSSSRQIIAMRLPYAGTGWFRFTTTESGRITPITVDITAHC